VIAETGARLINLKKNRELAAWDQTDLNLLVSQCPALHWSRASNRYCILEAREIVVFQSVYTFPEMETCELNTHSPGYLLFLAFKSATYYFNNC